MLGNAGPISATLLRSTPRLPSVSPLVPEFTALVIVLKSPPKLLAIRGSIVISAILSYIGPRLPARSIFFKSCPGDPKSPMLSKFIVCPRLPKSVPKSGNAFVMPVRLPLIMPSMPGKVPPANALALFVAAAIIELALPTNPSALLNTLPNFLALPSISEPVTLPPITLAASPKPVGSTLPMPVVGPKTARASPENTSKPALKVLSPSPLAMLLNVCGIVPLSPDTPLIVLVSAVGAANPWKAA